MLDEYVIRVFIVYLYRHNKATYVQEQLEILNNIFNCRLSDLNNFTLDDMFTTNWDKSRALANYRTCMQNYKKEINNSAHALQKCLPLAQKACDSSEIRVIKTIRVALYMIPDLLELDPDIQIVYYTRDPRAIVASRLVDYFAKRKNLTREVLIPQTGAICDQIREDEYELAIIEDNNRVHIDTLTYEQLVLRPNTSITNTYNRLGLCLPTNVLSWFARSTHAQTEDGSYGNSRRNGSSRVYRWQDLITEIYKQEIVKTCSGINFTQWHVS